jgi:hypothetical protein
LGIEREVVGETAAVNQPAQVRIDPALACGASYAARAASLPCVAGLLRTELPRSPTAAQIALGIELQADAGDQLGVANERRVAASMANANRAFGRVVQRRPASSASG